MLRQITLIGLIFFSLSCQKKNEEDCPYKNQECDSALFILLNRTQDTIFYGIGTNLWEDTLLPGQQRTLSYGRVEVTYDKNCKKNKASWSTHQLNSNFGSWAYHIDHCEKRSAFEYDGTSYNIIKLYDATEY